ncbi:LPXTG cell wall anchor domain-containing protein [Enterococcus sp. AZ072]|uniref:LPXTG cell wall anchor domain-containing protein n=1 Tax=unclassified Enterococcus TaxID=2608891 RepID=UPI003D276D35
MSGNNPLKPSSNKKLPSTGEKKIICVYLGLMLVSALVLYYLYRRKSLTRK